VNAIRLRNRGVKSLVQNGFAILNRYGFGVFNAGTSRDVHEHGDYIRVLETLQHSADAFAAPLERPVGAAPLPPQTP
jgi:hypothetical protein